MRFSMKLLGALPLLFATPSTAATFVYTGTLSGANEIPANGSTATGSYSLTLDDVLNSLSLSLSFSGLTGGAATAGHIHCCAAIGSNAPVVIPFSGVPNATSGSFSATFNNVSLANINGIKAGLAYINVHNAIFPGGEIRGQINAAVPEPATWATMLGGVGVAGAAMRRRRRRVPATV